MHRCVNIFQYVKNPPGRRQWAAIPKNRRTGNYVWARAKSNHFCIVWRQDNRRHYQKAGTTPAEVLEAQRKKEFELAGRAVLEQGRKIPKPQDQSGMAIEAAVEDYLDFIKKKKRPNTLKRYRAILGHFRAFFKPFTSVSAIAPADIDSFRDERLGQKNP